MVRERDPTEKYMSLDIGRIVIDSMYSQRTCRGVGILTSRYRSESVGR
jgi:hypothetical protein